MNEDFAVIIPNRFFVATRFENFQLMLLWSARGKDLTDQPDALAAFKWVTHHQSVSKHPPSPPVYSRRAETWESQLEQTSSSSRIGFGRYMDWSLTNDLTNHFLQFWEKLTIELWLSDRDNCFFLPPQERLDLHTIWCKDFSCPYHVFFCCTLFCGIKWFNLIAMHSPTKYNHKIIRIRVMSRTKTSLSKQATANFKIKQVFVKSPLYSQSGISSHC